MIKEPIAKKVLENGGFIKPLIIPSEYTDGSGLMNPSIFIDGDNILVNLRHVNYTIWHSEKKKMLHEWGPLVYLHPENYQKLKTTNHYLELDKNYNIKKHIPVDTTLLDVEPLWEFVGLEDARIIRWNDKLYLSGVRRDTTTNGQGRIELSEIVVDEYSVKEIKRYRLEPPLDKNSYCEKNWMPVIDKPFHYVKWTNPTEVVLADIETLSTSQIHCKGEYVSGIRDIRGGSQVIPWKNGYVALTHEVDLWYDSLNRKDGLYRHRVVTWDSNLENPQWGKHDFSFLGGNIEFCCGLALKDGMFLATFGFQDNSACLMGIPEKIIEELLEQ